MSFSLVIGPLTPEEINRAVATLTTAGIGIGTKVQDVVTGHADAALPVPPGTGTKPMPPMPPVPVAANAAVPPPPPTVAPPAPANAKLENVLKLMDSYSRAGHQVAGARKVLAVLGLSRAQDANEEQLDWLAAAFANTGWAP